MRGCLLLLAVLALTACCASRGVRIYPYDYEGEEFVIVDAWFVGYLKEHRTPTGDPISVFESPTAAGTNVCVGAIFCRTNDRRIFIHTENPWSVPVPISLQRYEVDKIYRFMIPKYRNIELLEGITLGGPAGVEVGPKPDEITPYIEKQKRRVVGSGRGLERSKSLLQTAADDAQREAALERIKVNEVSIQKLQSRISYLEKLRAEQSIKNYVTNPIPPIIERWQPPVVYRPADP